MHCHQQHMKIFTFPTFSPLGILKCLSVWHSSRWKLYFLICTSLIMSEMLIFSGIYILLLLFFLETACSCPLPSFLYLLSLLFCKRSLHANEIKPLLCITNISYVFDVWFSLGYSNIWFLKNVYSKFYHSFPPGFWVLIIL